MQHRRTAFWQRALLAVPAILMVAIPASAQGVTTKRNAVVLYGSPATCSQPATINHQKVKKATPEWQTIRSEGVRKGSARYELLVSAMSARIKRACKSAAESAGRDCVVRQGDIKDARGLTVKDLTAAVINVLES